MKRNQLAFVFTGILGCAVPTLNLHAQDSTSTPYYPLNLGVDVGLIGAGGSASFRFADHFAIAGEGDYLPYTYHGSIQSIKYDVNLRVLNEPVTLQVFPWANNSFHISLGAAFNQNHISATASGTDNTSITINGNTYNNPVVNMRISQQPIDPYLSLGGNIFYFDKAHHWSLGGEIGAMYTGTPKVSFAIPSSTPAVLPADVATEQQKIVNYADKLKFLPVLKLGVNVSF